MTLCAVGEIPAKHPAICAGREFHILLAAFVEEIAHIFLETYSQPPVTDVETGFERGARKQ